MGSFDQFNLGPGPCIVVDADQLEPRTKDGWLLISAYQETAPSNEFSGFGPGTRTRFILHKPDALKIP